MLSRKLSRKFQQLVTSIRNFAKDGRDKRLVGRATETNFKEVVKEPEKPDRCDLRKTCIKHPQSCL